MDEITSDGFLLICSFIELKFNMFLQAHCFACIFFVIGITEAGKGQSWILQQGLLDASAVEQYVNALYWSITTMTTVGYGDLKPVSSMEMITVICCMFIAVGNFTVILNTISQKLQRFNRQVERYRENARYVRRFLKESHCDKTLQIQAQQYLDHVLEKKQVVKVEENEVFQILNDGLKNKLTMEINGRLLGKFKVFK